MMDGIPWILLVLACPIGMLLMGGVMWLMAKGGGLFGRDDSERRTSEPKTDARP